MKFELTSTAFQHGNNIPTKYTCEGEDISPPLIWNGMPEGTQSLVLIIEDPDAPDPNAPLMTWIHWILYNLSPNITNLPEGVTSTNIPQGAKEGINSWNRSDYGGPCPPIGKHRYFHKLYALDTLLTERDNPTKDELESAIAGHILAQTELVGTYKKFQ